jgi:predicted nuclease of restriction endonuclease-like (RecB) superfamily
MPAFTSDLHLAETGRRYIILPIRDRMFSRPQDILKDPYVREFLGQEGRAAYSESDLEAAIVEHVQHFLLDSVRDFFSRRVKIASLSMKNTSSSIWFSTTVF